MKKECSFCHREKKVLWQVHAWWLCRVCMNRHVTGHGCQPADTLSVPCTDRSCTVVAA
jgi:hypothetical protein